MAGVEQSESIIERAIRDGFDRELPLRGGEIGARECVFTQNQTSGHEDESPNVRFSSDHTHSSDASTMAVIRL